MKESDLYPPLKQFLESQQYEVKAEIKNCDVVAIRENEEPVIVELKLSLNLDVVLQAVERLSISSKVYIGIPFQTKSVKKKKKKILKLMKMLGIGLILIETKRSKNNVTVLLDPTEYTPRTLKHKKERLLGEFTKRVGDPNLGGQGTRKKMMTAYRQQAICISQYLVEHTEGKPADISKALAIPNARAILYNNVYGWFERVSRGVYCLSPRGKKELPAWSDKI